ncbi:MAG: 30S ribosomal protein S7 [Spirochaetales bacterium]|jgi:small subunit ribosomal protein S7|nr:30S ribosomal protein S7 [Spirochaetales bacterium]
MPRKSYDANRPLSPDPLHNSIVVAKFVRRMMQHGQLMTSQKILEGAFGILKEKSGREPLEVFLKALDNVKPVVEVKSRRVGGSTYQVPVEIRDSRREALSHRWIILASRGRSGKSMAEKLAAELFDAFNNTGTAFKKKEDTHRMAEANKAFSHYKW